MLALKLCKIYAEKRANKHAYPFRIVKVMTRPVILLFSMDHYSRVQGKRLWETPGPQLGPDTGLTPPTVQWMISYLPRAPSLAGRQKAVLGGLQLPVTSSVPTGSHHSPGMR